MRIRRAATAVTTMIVAVAVALAVPIASLRTVTVVASCCCPDPAHCHCPDHDKHDSKAPTIRACHRTSFEYVSPELPAFEPTELAVAEPARRAVVTVFVASIPHEPPPPARPDAPS